RGTVLRRRAQRDGRADEVRLRRRAGRPARERGLVRDDGRLPPPHGGGGRLRPHGGVRRAAVGPGEHRRLRVLEHRCGRHARANWGIGPSRTIEQDLTNLPADEDEDGSLLYQAALEHQQNPPLREMWRAAPYRDSDVDMVEAQPWIDYSVATYREAIEESGVA